MWYISNTLHIAFSDTNLLALFAWAVQALYTFVPEKDKTAAVYQLRSMAYNMLLS